MYDTAKVAAILEAEGQIDNFRAINERITLRLAARIKDLRNAGWVIMTEKQPDSNCRYTLVSRPPATPQTLF